MKKKVRLVLIVVLVLVLAVAAIMLIRQQMDYRKGRSDYNEALSMAQNTTDSQEEGAKKDPVFFEAEVEEARDPVIAEMEELNWKILQQTNPDVIGWIRIPGTVVDYPILHTDNNWFYLDKTWKKEYSSVGSIFLETQNRADLTQFNTILYGHNMRDGSMFSNLKDYQDLEYCRAHPSIYIAVDGQVRRYDVFSVYEAAVWEPTYGLEITKEKHRQEYLDHAQAKSIVDLGVTPTIDDSFLTLSTCTGTGDAASGVRWVVQAVWNKNV